MTFAARDFSPRRGVSDEHIPQWICEERATKSGRKRPAALRVAPNLACGFVARRLQPHGRGCALLAPRHRPNWAQRTSSYLCFRPLSPNDSGFNLRLWPGSVPTRLIQDGARTALSARCSGEIVDNTRTRLIAIPELFIEARRARRSCSPQLL